MFRILFEWNRNDKRQRQIKCRNNKGIRCMWGSEKRVRWKSNFCVEIIVAKRSNKKYGSQSLMWMPQNIWTNGREVCGHTPRTCQTIPKARRQVINILWRSTRKRLRICIAAAHNIAENSFGKMLAAVVDATAAADCVYLVLCRGVLSHFV